MPDFFRSEIKAPERANPERTQCPGLIIFIFLKLTLNRRKHWLTESVPIQIQNPDSFFGSRRRMYVENDSFSPNGNEISWHEESDEHPLEADSFFEENSLELESRQFFLAD